MALSDDLENILATTPEESHITLTEHAREFGLVRTLAEEIIPKWTPEQQTKALEQVKKNEGLYKTVLVDIFKIDQTLSCNDSHRKFVKRVFLRAKDCFDELTADIIENHDLSKYRLVVHCYNKYSFCCCGCCTFN